MWYGKFLEGDLPITVHWINYWTEDVIREIGMEKIQKMVDGNDTISFRKGILSIKDTALDMGKEGDIRFHDKLQEYLFWKSKF